MNKPAEFPLDQSYWEQRYQTKDTPWDKGEPAPGLVDFLARKTTKPAGRVLVPGCGFGYDVRAWAEHGFEAVGYDISPSGARLANERLTGTRGSVRSGDFLHDSPEEQFDWLFEHTLFCAIHPTLRPVYAQAIRRWLKPGGHFLAVHYIIPDTDGPPFGTTREEVIERFGGFLELIEEWVPRSYPNRTGLERMFLWRYPSRTA